MANRAEETRDLREMSEPYDFSMRADDLGQTAEVDGRVTDQQLETLTRGEIPISDDMEALEASRYNLENELRKVQSKLSRLRNRLEQCRAVQGGGGGRRWSLDPEPEPEEFAAMESAELAAHCRGLEQSFDSVLECAQQLDANSCAVAQKLREAEASRDEALRRAADEQGRSSSLENDAATLRAQCNDLQGQCRRLVRVVECQYVELELFVRSDRSLRAVNRSLAEVNRGQTERLEKMAHELESRKRLEEVSGLTLAVMMADNKKRSDKTIKKMKKLIKKVGFKIDSLNTEEISLSVNRHRRQISNMTVQDGVTDEQIREGFEEIVNYIQTQNPPHSH